jgi:uncharacterized protein YndB with AHSA1/START domain
MHTALAVVIGVAIVVAGVFALASTRPDAMSIHRATIIKAPREAVFALIDDFHRWTSWAPQDLENPSMVRTFDGPVKGGGAISEWSGTGSAGRGRMEITESVPSSRVTVTVDFRAPFVAHNVNTFLLEPEGDSTRITWTMQGTNPFPAKVMSLFMNMDRVLGAHFETGLKNLKAATEK